MQKQSKKEQTETPLIMDKNALESLQKTPKTRIVILRSESCCGCGCSDIKVKRTVPYDSKYQDGMYLKSDDVTNTDEIIWD